MQAATFQIWIAHSHTKYELRAWWTISWWGCHRFPARFLQRRRRWFAEPRVAFTWI